MIAEDFQLPPFQNLQSQDLHQAVRQVMLENQRLVERLGRRETPPTWDSLLMPLQEAEERLARLWNMVAHLHGVNDVAPWRELYNELLPLVTHHWAAQGQNSPLAAQFQTLADGPEYSALSAARRRVVDLELRNFRLNGAALPAAPKQRFLEVQQQLASLSAKFSENLLDATNHFYLHLRHKASIDGLPEAVVAAAQQEAQRRKLTGWVLTLQAPCYLPVMQYSTNRSLRRRLYRTYGTRASEYDNIVDGKRLDNGPVMVDILKLRQECAALLGMASYAHLSLQTKMAKSPQEVEAFLLDLAARARPYAVKEKEALLAHGAELGMATVEPCDLAFLGESLRRLHFDFSQEEVRSYFPEDRVLPGMMDLVAALFQVHLRPTTAPTWHPQVKVFEATEADGAVLGYLYLDLYARPEKRGGAWMDDAVGRARFARGLQKPVAYLSCNFPAPIGGEPARFNHEEVLTLLHELGHGLHHLLTQVDEFFVSGMRGVEWDAVELPSQFMENFGWQYQTLEKMSASPAGQTLPRALFDKMFAAKNFQMGLHTLRQVEFSLFDLRLHLNRRINTPRHILQCLHEVRSEVSVLSPPRWHRFPQGFSHVFAGGYAAGYYSYKWAEVLSADAFAAFEEKDVAPATMGKKFRQEILSVGATRPSMDSFQAFRGRTPDIQQLLRHSGMIGTS